MKFQFYQAVTLLTSSLRLVLALQIPFRDGQHIDSHRYETGMSETNVVEHGAVDIESTEFCKKVSVDWPVGEDEWRYSGTAKLYNIISEYNLHDNGLSIYSYKLEVRMPMLIGEFFFYDEEGDCYDLTTARTGDHFVRYNSKKPRIVTVGYNGSCDRCKRR